MNMASLKQLLLSCLSLPQSPAVGNRKRQEQQIKVHGHLLPGLGLEGSMWVRAVSFAGQQPPFAGSLEVLVHMCYRPPNPSWGTKLTSEACRPTAIPVRQRAEEMSVCSLLYNGRGYIMQLSWVISGSKSSFSAFKTFLASTKLVFPLFLLGNQW